MKHYKVNNRIPKWIDFLGWLTYQPPKTILVVEGGQMFRSFINEHYKQNSIVYHSGDASKLDVIVGDKVVVYKSPEWYVNLVDKIQGEMILVKDLNKIINDEC